MDSKLIFDTLKVSKGNEINQFKNFQEKYHTIYLNLSKNVNYFVILNNYLPSINEALIEDITKS
ncbi:hypothetical protein U3516DRAFT_779962 [Neocallimastix sp. 'constans']